jgi:hypothetical protein
LQLDLLAVNVDHARAKLHAYGQVVDWLKPLVCELKQQAGLAHAYRAKKSVLIKQAQAQ